MLGRYARRFMEESRSWGQIPWQAVDSVPMRGLEPRICGMRIFTAFWKGNIVDQLAKPRGFECMDEYIASVAGFNFAEMDSHLKMAAVVTMGNTPDAKTEFSKCLTTMFGYGMVIEINKLGLTGER